MSLEHPPHLRLRASLCIWAACLLALSGFAASRWLRVSALDGGPLMPAAISAHHVMPYKAVAWHHAGDALVIETDRPPGGLYFTYDLDPDRRYLVHLRGETLHGSPVLRVRKDRDTPDWQLPPDGEATSVVSGISGLELLMYSDASFGYRLDALSIEECAACLTDEDLKREILEENPGLAGLLEARPLAAAADILRWASPRIDFALDQAVVEAGDRAVAAASAADAYYRLFSTTSPSGVFCSGASIFASRVLQLFGFEAAPINFGIPGTDLTHVAVVVAHDDDDGRRFHLLDPTFNATFHLLGNGRLASLTDLIGALRQGRFEDIRVVEAPLERRKWIFAGEPADMDHPNVTDCTPATDGDRLISCSLPAFNLEYYTHSFGEQLQAEGLHQDARAYVQLLEAGVFTFGPFATEGATRALLARLRELDIPYRGAHPRRLDRLRSAIGSLIGAR